MTKHYDALETRDPAQREAALLAALPGHVAQAQRSAPAFAEILRGVDAAAVTSRAALARAAGDAQARTAGAPAGERAHVMRATHLAVSRPSAGAACCAARARAGSTSRPVRSTNPRGRPADYWRSARAMSAAGFEAGDLVHNCFSYHLTPGAWIMEAGAQALGCTVFPGGVGNTEQQLAAMRRPAARGLRRHAQLPEDPGREGRTRRAPGCQLQQGPGQRRGLSAQPARLVGRARHRRLPVLRHGRRRPDRLRDRRRAKAWCWTKA